MIANVFVLPLFTHTTLFYKKKKSKFVKVNKIRIRPDFLNDDVLEFPGQTFWTAY